MPRPVFSEEEIKYIIENADIMSQSEIAQNLSVIFKDDNNGKRSRSGVHNILQQIRKEKERKI